jgi:CRP/FNR family transcriptional regulator, cyclic AMP receptor protein
VAVSTRDTIAMLEEVPLFAGCSKRDLQAVAASLKEVERPQGAVIAKEGDTGLGFFLIVDGTASVSVGGKPRAKLGPRDFFGEISLLDHGPRTATVTATSPIRLLGLTAWTFRSLVEQHPRLALNMLKVVAGRLRTASNAATS